MFDKLFPKLLPILARIIKTNDQENNLEIEQRQAKPNTVKIDYIGLVCINISTSDYE